MKDFLIASVAVLSILFAAQLHAEKCVPKIETHKTSGQKYYPVNFNAKLRNQYSLDSHGWLVIDTTESNNEKDYFLGPKFFNQPLYSVANSERLEVFRSNGNKYLKMKYSAKPGKSWIVDIGGCKYKDIILYNGRGPSIDMSDSRPYSPKTIAGIEGTIINSSK